MVRPPSFIIALTLVAVWASAAHGTTTTTPLQAGRDHALANSMAIQTALDHASTGDTIDLPPGTFSISRTIALRSGIDIVGDSQSKTFLSATFDTNQPMITGNRIASVDVHGFTLDGAGNANVTQGIELENATSLKIHDLAIQNLPGSDRPSAPLGPHAVDCTSAVTNSVFNAITCRSIGVGRTWGGGIRLSWKSSGNRVSNCTVENTGRGGIFCNDGSTDNIITGNTVSGSGGVGLGIEVQNCDRSLILDNRIDHWLSVDNSSGSAIRRNTIIATDESYKLCGIEVVNSHDIVVTDNSIGVGAKVGLSISGDKPKMRMLFARNLIQRATTWGMQIQGEAGGARQLFFQANQFLSTQIGPSPLYPNQGHAVRLNGNCQSIVFEDNEIAHSAGAGIQITGDNVSQIEFLENTLDDNRAGTIDAGAIPHLTWIDNRASPPVPQWDRISENLPLSQAKVSFDTPIDTPITFGKPIRFSASISNFAPTAWLWDFNDGLPATAAAPTHAFSKSGFFLIELIAWDSAGHAARATATVVAKEPSATTR